MKDLNSVKRAFVASYEIVYNSGTESQSKSTSFGRKASLCALSAVFITSEDNTARNIGLRYLDFFFLFSL